MDFESKIYVAGHRGLVGAALVRRLQAEGFENLLLKPRGELDLTDQAAVRAFFAKERPEYVFLAAAKVGGIYANSANPADFIRDNLLIQTNVIDAAFENKVTKLMFLGSSCIYPRDAKQPIEESALLTGPLEPTNKWYAVAKIAGIIHCQALRRQHGFDAISVMPTNLYGPGDNFHPENSHVIPGLLRRCHEAKIQASSELKAWGTGRATREFLHVDDLADALVFLMQHYSEEEVINVGSGEEVSIAELVELVAEVVGFQGSVVFSNPEMDGTPRKLLDSSRIGAMGWRPGIGLKQGLEETYRWFLDNVA